MLYFDNNCCTPLIFVLVIKYFTIVSTYTSLFQERILHGGHRQKDSKNHRVP